MTESFVQAKKIGRKFESQVRDVLREVGKEKGIELIDSETLSYSQKKGWDCEVKLASGARCKLEMKFDVLSETTGNVCVDLDSLSKSISPIWVYGLPEGNQVHLYTMFLSDLAPFAKSWPIKRLGGEWATPIALVPKATFLGQDWVKKFKTIKLDQNGNCSIDVATSQ